MPLSRPLRYCLCFSGVVFSPVQLAPKEKQLQEARTRNQQLLEQLRSVGSQLADVQRDLQRAREDASSQVKVRSKQRLLCDLTRCAVLRKALRVHVYAVRMSSPFSSIDGMKSYAQPGA